MTGSILTNSRRGSIDATPGSATSPTSAFRPGAGAAGGDDRGGRTAPNAAVGRVTGAASGGAGTGSGNTTAAGASNYDASRDPRLRR